jgi:hypothetical protein
VLVAGGSFAPARTIALDRLGRTVAYGRGAGETRLLAACAGGARVAEVVAHGSGWSLAIRELRTMRVVRSRPLPAPGGIPPAAVGCSARDAFVFFGSSDFPARARLVRAGPGALVPVWRGTATAASFAGGRAYLNRGPAGREVARLDLATGRLAAVGRVPEGTGPLTPSPDGRLLAGVAVGDQRTATPPPPRIVLLDGRRVRTVAAGYGTVAWAGQDRLAFFPAGEPQEARLYDRALRLRDRIRPWQARTGAVAGGSAYGIGWEGEVLRAALPDGRARAVGRLPSPVVHALVPVR